MDDSVEEWKPVVDFEDVYLVSTLGNVRRICKYCGPSHYWELKSHRHKQEYRLFTLCRCHKRKRAFGHILVAETFLGPKPPGMVVNHKDCDKQNNRLSNLEYITKLADTIHGIVNGRRSDVKLDPAKVKAIRSVQGTKSSTEIAAEYKVCSKHIERIWRRVAWAHVA